MPASSLPQPLTRLIGRDAARAEARELLLRQGVRLVTFSGTGDIGKTRLALELATDLSDRFVDGVWFIPLDGLNDSGQVLSAIMLAAGVAESATQVQHDVLRTSLSGKHVLLVLDNFEHVIDAAPEVASLLRECPCLTILVTSRTLLRISGEQVFPVPPLEHGDAASPAVALFSERASAILPSFRLNASTAPIVEDICRLLDGLPLAIELAAARVNTLSLSALRDRLIWQMTLLTGGHRDAPKRHRTMRDAIAWSYDFLSADEQVVLRRLSVFAGGFPIDAVPWVVIECSEEEVNFQSRDTEAEDRILDIVGSLIDKSLLQRADQENRLAMLSPIRAYALEQLVATGDEIATRNRHVAWCLEFAQGLLGGWNDAPVDPCWLRSADAEHDNIRAALAWMESQHDGPGLLRLAIQIRWIWEVRGLSSEAVNWFERGLEIASDAEPSLRLKAHAILGRTLRRRGRYDLARQHLHPRHRWPMNSTTRLPRHEPFTRWEACKPISHTTTMPETS